MSASRLFVGVGNHDRGDDGAGPSVIRRLTGHRTVEVRDCADLVEIWSGEEEVVVIDAMVSGSPPGTIKRFDGIATELPTASFGSTHSLGLPAAIGLSRALGRLPRSLCVYGVEAADLRPGAAMTPEVQGAVLRIVGELESGSA